MSTKFEAERKVEFEAEMAAKEHRCDSPICFVDLVGS
jgi:hypothetical protein